MSNSKTDSHCWILLLPATLLLVPTRAADADDKHWPSFRGPRASGVARGAAAPVRWSVAEGRNVRWKLPIPGLGHSSPVVWENRVYITTSVRKEGEARLKVGLYGDIAPVNDDTEHSWRLYCVDKENGKILWERTAHRGVPKVKRHPKSTHANSTPATDGKHVLAFFGSEGLYCYDADGKLLWKKDLGLLDSAFFRAPAAQWAFGSSPVIHENTVIVQCDVLRECFLAAFDVKDGREIWRTPREDVPTWSTPTIHTEGGRSQVIVNGHKHIGGYDTATGKELWKLRGGGDIPVPTPVAGHGLIFITNAHGGKSPIYAVRTSATGDLTLDDGSPRKDDVPWSTSRRGNYMPTPLVYGNHLYCSNDGGILTCYVAKTGEMLYRNRLGAGRSGFTASPVAADGKIYVTSEEGDVHVVESGPEFKLVATNAMNEVCMATPAISGGMLLFRTRGHLIAIAEATPSSEGDS